MKQKIITHAKSLIYKMFETEHAHERMAILEEIRQLMNAFPELRERFME